MSSWLLKGSKPDRGDRKKVPISLQGSLGDRPTWTSKASKIYPKRKSMWAIVSGTVEIGVHLLSGLALFFQCGVASVGPDKTRRIPETTVSRILVFMWSSGFL